MSPTGAPPEQHRGRARKRRSARRITRSGSHGDRVERVEADGGLGDGQSAGVSPDGVDIYGDRLHLDAAFGAEPDVAAAATPRSPGRSPARTPSAGRTRGATRDRAAATATTGPRAHRSARRRARHLRRARPERSPGGADRCGVSTNGRISTRTVQPLRAHPPVPPRQPKAASENRKTSWGATSTAGPDTVGGQTHLLLAAFIMVTQLDTRARRMRLLWPLWTGVKGRWDLPVGGQ